VQQLTRFLESRAEIICGPTQHSALGRLRLVCRLNATENLANIALCDLNVVINLQIQPKLCCCAERFGEPKRSIGGNAGLLARDPLDPRAGQAASLGKSAPQTFSTASGFLPQNFTGMHGFKLLGHFGVLVVVHDLDLYRAFRRPNKAHPELVVNPD
jgi:hypothetical protein